MDVDSPSISAQAFHSRVYGSLLSKFTGWSVLLVGQVLKVVGGTAALRASDGQSVTVNMQPGSSYTTEFVEILGTVVDSQTVQELQAREVQQSCGKYYTSGGSQFAFV